MKRSLSRTKKKRILKRHSIQKKAWGQRKGGRGAVSQTSRKLEGPGLEERVRVGTVQGNKIGFVRGVTWSRLESQKR